MIVRPAYAIAMVISVIAACTGTDEFQSGFNENKTGTRNVGSRSTGSDSGGTDQVGDDGTSKGSDPSDSTKTETGGGGTKLTNPGTDAGQGGKTVSVGNTGGNNKDGGTGKGGAANGGTNASGTGGKAEECTDIQTSDHQGEPCSIWVEWGHCDKDWLQGFCNKTCGRCTGGSSNPGTNPGTGGTGGSTGGGSGIIPNSSESVAPLGSDAQSGWASRYWDCCKPHCAWPGKAPNGQVKMCSMSNAPLSDPSAASSCNGGPAYTCWDMAPWALSDKLAYGYAATPAGGNDCGKCYQLDFTGSGKHNANDPGSKAMAGKSMIVQATNIGGDVGSGQFDIMVPGGGVGAFNACSTQWGASNLGAQYGGFVNECDSTGTMSHDALKSCVENKCREVFKNGKDQLLKGCLFYVEWFQAANNPQLRYKQVPCPKVLSDKSGVSG